MLKAARAQGSPMIVIAMITVAISHPSAIQMPPVRIQSTFRTMLTGDIRALLSAFSVHRSLARATWSRARTNPNMGMIGRVRQRLYPAREVPPWFARHRPVLGRGRMQGRSLR